MVSRLIHCHQTVIPWANKWYRSRASAVVILTDSYDRRFGVGRWQWHCHSAQPLPEVVVRTVREVSGTTWSTLTRTNNGEWSVTMKVKLRARRLWNAVDKGTDVEEDDMSALEAILATMPAEYREPLGRRTLLKSVGGHYSDARRLRPRKEGDGLAAEVGIRHP